MRNLYALLLTAMSMEEAKVTLGFPPTESPSREEISKAWKQKAFENHPDRGGDPRKMVEINVAKDILEGKERPTYSRPEPPSATPPGYGRTYTPPVERKDNIVTFDEAKSKSGIPSGVEWIFVTERQRSKHGYSSDEYQRSETAFVAYGQTESKHVFAVALHSYYAAYVIGGGPKTDVWKIASLEYPRRDGEKLEPSWLYGNIVKALKKVDFEGKFNSKVADIRGHKFDDDLPNKNRSTMSIKHILVALGMVAGDDPSVAGRKQVVEITVEDSFRNEGKPGFYPEAPSRSNTWDGGYHGSYYKVTLIINGRKFDLDEHDFTEFSKVRLGGNRLLNAIFGDYVRGKKTLTRLRQGKLILQWLAENLRGLPADAMSALDAAAKQMK